MDSSDENENAVDIIRIDREVGPNEIDENDLHCEKQRAPRTSILPGIKIDLRDENKNAVNPIRISREGDSNEIHEIDLQFEKQPDPRILTVPGIKTD
jgi:hypothetical protein